MGERESGGGSVVGGTSVPTSDDGANIGGASTTADKVRDQIISDITDARRTELAHASDPLPHSPELAARGECECDACHAAWVAKGVRVVESEDEDLSLGYNAKIAKERASAGRALFTDTDDRRALELGANPPPGGLNEATIARLQAIEDRRRAEGESSRAAILEEACKRTLEATESMIGSMPNASPAPLWVGDVAREAEKIRAGVQASMAGHQWDDAPMHALASVAPTEETLHLATLRARREALTARTPGALRSLVQLGPEWMSLTTTEAHLDAGTWLRLRVVHRASGMTGLVVGIVSVAPGTYQDSRQAFGDALLTVASDTGGGEEINFHASTLSPYARVEVIGEDSVRPAIAIRVGPTLQFAWPEKPSRWYEIHPSYLRRLSDVSEADRSIGIPSGESSPSSRLVSSVEVLRRPGAMHDEVRIWNRGGLCGDLTVKAGDGTAIKARLLAEDEERSERLKRSLRRASEGFGDGAILVRSTLAEHSLSISPLVRSDLERLLTILDDGNVLAGKDSRS